MLKLNVNGKMRSVDVEGEMPLLFVLRDHLGLLGAKYGCGIGACGACTVHLDGMPVRSCSLPVAQAVGKKVVTIEGLSAKGMHKLQQAWIEHEVPQCGYCQTGMMMSAAALLAAKPKPSDADIDQAMTNLCRCGTYRGSARRSTPWRKRRRRKRGPDHPWNSPSKRRDFLKVSAAVGGGSPSNSPSRARRMAARGQAPRR
jgi:isoquinoline 1-oxidoreductase alpha subunit